MSSNDVYYQIKSFTTQNCFHNVRKTDCVAIYVQSLSVRNIFASATVSWKDYTGEVNELMWGNYPYQDVYGGIPFYIPIVHDDNEIQWMEDTSFMTAAQIVDNLNANLRRYLSWIVFPDTELAAPFKNMIDIVENDLDAKIYRLA